MRTTIGVEAKYSASEDLHVSLAGATGKIYVADADLLLQAEVEVAHDRIVAGGAADRVMGYLLATRPIAASWLLDIGIGHYTQNLDVAGLYRDALDINVHWFATSHTELLLNTRLEALDHGTGPVGGYALVQLHYRI